MYLFSWSTQHDKWPPHLPHSQKDKKKTKYTRQIKLRLVSYMIIYSQGG